MKQARLPERDGYNGLHRHKLVKWIERCEALLSCLIEKHQEVEGKRDADIVDEGEPREAAVHIVGAVTIDAVLVKNNCQNRSNWLD